ncbi:hypothetical protein ACOMHN_054531 [Nucella lapillus]
MEGEGSDQLVTLVVKAIQAYCSGHVDFRSCVEVIGHIHLSIDGRVGVDYVVSEAMVKAVSGSDPSFSSRTYLSHPPPRLSQFGEADRARHSPGSHDSASTLLRHQDEACVNVLTDTSQTLPADGSHSFAAGVTGSGDTLDQMRVTVSFDPSSALPLIKQESSPTGEVVSPEGDPPGADERCRPVSDFPLDHQQSPDMSALRTTIQPTHSYLPENHQPSVPYGQTNGLPPLSLAGPYPQHRGQLAAAYSQTSQPAALTESSLMQIQDVHSQALRTVVTSQQPGQTSTLSSGHLQQDSSYLATSQVDDLQPSALSQHRTSPGAAYVCAGHPQEEGEPDLEHGSVNGAQTDSPLAGGFLHGPALSVTSGREAGVGEGVGVPFGSLCLDGVMVKEEEREEVGEESQASPHGSYTPESGQEQTLVGFSQLVMESLGHPVDGTQLIVVREGLPQGDLPFPVMLHANAGLSVSPSVNPPHGDDERHSHSDSGPGKTASRIEMVIPCSSTDLSPETNFVMLAAEQEAGGCRTSQRGFQPGNQCWKLQQRWDTVTKARKRFHKKTPSSLTDSADSMVFKMLSSTRKIELVHDKLRSASTAAKMASLSSSKTKNKGAVVHTLKKVPWTVQKKQPRKICNVCREKGLFLMSCYFCPQCPQQQGFCRVRSCFASFHSQMGLKFTADLKNLQSLGDCSS